MREHKKNDKALTLLDSTTKQIITLSTGSILLSAIFLEKIVGINFIYREYLITSWILFSIAILSGLLVLGAVIRNINYGKYDVYLNNTRLLSIIQYGTFFLGLVVFWIFTLLNV